MGACWSTKTAEDQDLNIPRNVSVVYDQVLRQKSAVGGLQLMPSISACPATFPYELYSKAVVTDTHIFAALFEGSNGPQAAEHAVAHCYPAVCTRLEHNGGDAEGALRQMFKDLDASFMASTQHSDEVKARSSCTAVVVFINLAKPTCTVAALGSGSCFVGRTRGAFNNVSVEVKTLLSETVDRSAAEREEDWNQIELGTPKPAVAGGGKVSAAAGAKYRIEELPAGRRQHCIGAGYGKDKRLRDAWKKAPATAKGLRFPHIDVDCEVSTHRITPGDEHLVMASEGMMRLVPPAEAALLCSQFSVNKIRTLRGTYSAAAGGNLGLVGGGAAAQLATGEAAPLEFKPLNVASILVRHAVQKSINNYNASHGTNLSWADVTRLDLQVLSEDQGAATLQAEQQQQRQQQQPHRSQSRLRTTKLDVHPDVAAMVLSLDWPMSSTARQMQLAQTLQARRCRNPAASYRWQLLRLWYKFTTARRRNVIQRWYGIIDEALVAAEKDARKAEIAAWRELGQAVMVKRNGQVVSKDVDDVSPDRRRPTALTVGRNCSPAREWSPVKTPTRSVRASRHLVDTRIQDC